MWTHESDINEHIPTLIKYGSECDSIIEMGVRWITSTWGFLGCAPKNGLISIDMRNPSTWNVGGKGENQAIIQRGYNTIEEVEEIAKEIGVDYKFIQVNVLDIDIEETDLLFLDTWHSFKQLKAELNKFHSKVKKYIICHDTSTYANIDETNYEVLGPEWKANIDEKQGIWSAIEEFLENNKDWKLEERIMYNNGLTILKRI